MVTRQNSVRSRAKRRMRRFPSPYSASYAQHLHVGAHKAPLNQLERPLLGEKCCVSTEHQVAPMRFQAMKGWSKTRKAQITVAYIYRAGGQDSPIITFWVTAASAEVIITHFMKLAERLPSVSLQGEEEKQDRRTLGEAVKHWQEQGPPHSYFRSSGERWQEPSVHAPVVMAQQ